MSDRFDAPSVKRAGIGMENGFFGNELLCQGCGKKFAKEFDFRRHWRVPVTCQIHHCTKTFRDDKLRGYLNHHEREHSTDGPTEFTQDQLESYFRDMARELRHAIVPNLCVSKLNRAPEADVHFFGNTPNATSSSSAKPFNGVWPDNTVDTGVYASSSPLSVDDTSIGPSPSNAIMNRFLKDAHVGPSSPQFTQIERGNGYAREELQRFSPDGSASYLKEQISQLEADLSNHHHHTAYLQRLLAENYNTEQEIKGKIKVAGEELEKMVRTKLPEPQAPSGYQVMLDTLIIDPALASYDGE